MAQTLGNLPVGALVQDPSTTYLGKPITMKIRAKNHAGYPANSVTLMSENILCLKAFDAIEASNTDSSRRSYGNNRWIYSNIRKWLNSDLANWYSAQHSTDAPPSNANVWSNYNEYDAEAGFLSGFSSDMKEAMMDTTLTVGKATVDGGGTETCVDKVFFPSCTEVNLAGDHTCGTVMSGFSDNTSRLQTPTAEAVAESEYTNSSFKVGSAWYYWLRDAYASYSCNVRYVASSGALSSNYAYLGTGGVCPLWNLPSSISVSDSPNSDGVYEITWNAPPQISGSDSDLGDKTTTFSQAYTVTDEEGDTTTVTEKINGATKRTFTVSLGAENSFDVNQSEWVALQNGANTISIHAQDSMGGATEQTHTFNKMEGEIFLTLETPLPADDCVSVGTMTVTRSIPSGASFSVEVCNNGYDDEPTWEDVTTAIETNKKFDLTNTSKTAENWGFNLRIKVSRNQAVGDCYITYIGGNFE